MLQKRLLKQALLVGLPNKLTYLKKGFSKSKRVKAKGDREQAGKTTLRILDGIAWGIDGDV